MPPKTFDQFEKTVNTSQTFLKPLLRWYGCSWKAWEKYQPDFIINARQADVSAATLNCYLRALNEYFRWAGFPWLQAAICEHYPESDYAKNLVNRLSE